MHTEVLRRQLLAMVCDIDACGKWFAPLYQQRLLQDGERHRVCQGRGYKFCQLP